MMMIMHHSDNPHRETYALDCYIDDSGSGTSRVAVVGGPVFIRDSFLKLTRQWVHILAVHKIKPPIHMKEFARPDGRLAYLTNEERYSLFSDVVPLINELKVYSLSASVNNLEFQEFFPKVEYHGRFGSTALAFLWCLILNHCLALEHKDTIEQISYVLSESSENLQMGECHRFLTSFESVTNTEVTGSFSLDTPRRIDALQVADMIAWANHRKWTETPFDQGFGPLQELTTKQGSDATEKLVIHYHFNVTSKSTRRLAAVLGKPVRKKGVRTSLLQEFGKHLNR